MVKNQIIIKIKKFFKDIDKIKDEIIKNTFSKYFMVK